jgi:hypothetical protein
MPIAIPFEHGRELGVHGIWIYAPSNHNAPQTRLPGGQRLKVLERMPQVAPGRERPKALPQGPLPARPAPLVGRATLVDNIALGDRAGEESRTAKDLMVYKRTQIPFTERAQTSC